MRIEQKELVFHKANEISSPTSSSKRVSGQRSYSIGLQTDSTLAKRDSRGCEISYQNNKLSMQFWAEPKKELLVGKKNQRWIR